MDKISKNQKFISVLEEYLNYLSFSKEENEKNINEILRIFDIFNTEPYISFNLKNLDYTVDEYLMDTDNEEFKSRNRNRS